MDEHALLLRHLHSWADQKRRSVDLDLVGTALRLRWDHDELEAGFWPAGSAERLLLVTWPAYGESPADPDAVVVSLEVLWRFLRATGRMRARSATPLELRTEARRAAPRMAEASSDPANRSAGRVLLDFGRSIGIDIESADGVDAAQQRLDEIQSAWNDLPIAERRRLMPDPSPKSTRGRAFTDLVNDAVPTPRRGDPHQVVHDVKASRFVGQCLDLAAWVGAGREITSIGVLRPAVARTAYRELELWEWDRVAEQLWHSAPAADGGPEADRLRAEAAANAIVRAGDCFALDRLWYPCVAAGLVELSGRRARAAVLPDEDELVGASLTLLVALAMRIGGFGMAPVLGATMIALGADEAVQMREIEDWWDGQARWDLGEAMLRDIWQNRLRRGLVDFDDAGIWRRDSRQLHLTEFGREVALAWAAATEDGLLATED